MNNRQWPSENVSLWEAFSGCLSFLLMLALILLVPAGILLLIIAL